MAVETEKLDIWAVPGDDIFVEGNPVAPSALLAPTAENVVDIEASDIIEAAAVTPPTEVVDGGLAGGAVPVVPTLAVVLAYLVLVLRSPLAHVLLAGSHSFSVGAGKSFCNGHGRRL